MTAAGPAQKSPAPAAARPRPVPGILNDTAELARVARIKTLIIRQNWIIAGLALVFAVALPLTLPAYSYFARTPDNRVRQMVGLDMPNMTNRAVLSWVTTSVTEIMTMGFGDMDVKLPKEKVRFTTHGWDIYTDAFVRQKIGETFKQNQLVLTTAPSNVPVITAQGVNPDGAYQWNVQMPVIMTYATNNNVTDQKRALVSLSITRVPISQSPAGIAIQNWDLQ